MRKRAVVVSIFFQISTLFLAMFAFSFILSQSQTVSAIVPDSDPSPAVANNPTQSFQHPVAKQIELSGGLDKSTVQDVQLKDGTAAQAYLTKDKSMAVTKSGDTFQLDSNGNAIDASIGTSNLVGKTDSYSYSSFGNLYTTQNFFVGNLLQGVTAAIAVAGAIQLIGSLAGLDQGVTTSLTLSATSGILAYKSAVGLFGKSTNQLGSGGIVSKSLTNFQAGLIGIGVAAAVFVLTYKTEKKKLVKFACLPWEPPLGGSQCEQCNKDPFRPCSEYRCKSLGQACQLLNPATGQELCSWVSRNDVTSPKIQPWIAALKPIEYKLKYVPDTAIRPPAIGTKITSSSGTGCLPAFTPLEFGITTDEPAQCKIEYNHTSTFDAMQFFVGESNYYSYNHTQKMRLPSPSSSVEGPLAPELRNDGTFSLYVRCRDANGNQNVDEYVINFCVDQGPDNLPPLIESFSIPSGSFVTFKQENVPIEVYVNEPSQCKWSRESKSYDDMENSLACSSQSHEVNANLQYTCAGNLTGVKDRDASTFYFRCKDQPTKADNLRNVNVQSTPFVLKGSQPLYIANIAPNASASILDSTETVPVNLQVETINGANEGVALCSFSPTGARDSYIAMFATDSYLHSQSLSLTGGNYTYSIRCVDAGGNAAEGNTTFSVIVDKQEPKVTRAYRQEGLKVVMNEDAECSYSLTSCNFNIDEGIKMIYSRADDKKNLFAEWKPTAVYHIKCRDSYGNQPSPNACSIVASAIDITKKSK